MSHGPSSLKGEYDGSSTVKTRNLENDRPPPKTNTKERRNKTRTTSKIHSGSKVAE